MYRTQHGEKHFDGAIGEIIKIGLGCAVRDIVMFSFVDDEPYLSGFKVFDRLERNQQLLLLHRIGHALLRSDYPAPPLVSVNEVTVAVIFQAFEVALEGEFEREDLSIHEPPDDPYEYRRLILACYGNESDDPDYPLPKLEPGQDDADEWKSLLWATAETIYWDLDFEDEDIYVDLPPEHSKALKRMMDVPEDYYTDTPELPSLSETKTLLDELANLTGERCRLPEEVGGQDDGE